jgi:hypothetical protein
MTERRVMLVALEEPTSDAALELAQSIAPHLDADVVAIHVHTGGSSDFARRAADDAEVPLLVRHCEIAQREDALRAAFHELQAVAIVDRDGVFVAPDVEIALDVQQVSVPESLRSTGLTGGVPGDGGGAPADAGRPNSWVSQIEPSGAQ